MRRLLLAVFAVFAVACNEADLPGSELPEVATSEESTQPATPPPPRYTVYARKDISYGSVRRLQLRVEVPEWPVSREAALALVRQLIERQRGQGWQAISVVLEYDRREILPAFGAFEWAPGGIWEDADEGDGYTWDGYELTIARLADKFAHPAACSPPPAEAFAYAKELFRGPVSKSDQEIMAEIAERHGVSREHVLALILREQDWEDC